MMLNTMGSNKPSKFEENLDKMGSTINSEEVIVPVGINKSAVLQLQNLKTIVGTGKIEKGRIVARGIKTVATEDGGYSFNFGFGDDDFILNVTVDKDGNLTNQEVLDNGSDVTNDEFFNLHLKDKYLTNARKEYQEIITAFGEQCVRPETSVYLLPEQKDYYQRRLNQCVSHMKGLEVITQSDHNKIEFFTGRGENGLPSSADDVSSERHKIKELEKELDELSMAIAYSTLPQPYGDEVMAGSLVSYRISGKNKSFNGEVLLIEGSYDASGDNDIKFCTMNSPVGEAVNGQKAGYAGPLSGDGRSVTVLNVDNEFVYNRYAEEYAEQISETSVHTVTPELISSGAQKTIGTI